jgi:helix-turn-helix protein
MSQSINFRAVQWAYEQHDLNVTAKAVLMTFAMHANERGYSYPGVERIASTWGMDRETVRRQIEALLVRRKIYGTKKRCGATGQVKIYRLPKITYESSGKRHRFQENGSGGKARDKRGISGGKSTPNNDNNRTKNKYYDASKALGNSTTLAPANDSPKSVSSFFEAHQNQNQPVQNHVKWPEFAAYCRRKSGTPTEKGFWTWWRKQKPQWRNKVKKNFDQEGWELNGQFFTTAQANELGLKNPELLPKFRKATKSGDKIHVIDQHLRDFLENRRNAHRSSKARPNAISLNRN